MKNSPVQAEDTNVSVREHGRKHNKEYKGHPLSPKLRTALLVR